MSLSIEETLKKVLDNITADLDRTINFWLQHSHDDKHGGFLTCLGENGKPYDHLKYGWLQGRQVWMYARLYNEVSRFHQPSILSAAVEGAQFMMRYMKDKEAGRCYFLMTREGRPIKMQRTIFTESFYVMALSEVHRATKDEQYKTEALLTMDSIIKWVKNENASPGRLRMEGAEPSSSLAVPMILVGLIDQLQTMDSSLSSKYCELKEWSIQQLLKHVQRDGAFVLENVTFDGKEVEGSMGRLTIPGHAIECGWFLLKLAISENNAKLQARAIQDFMERPLEYGWDKEHGGLFYFLDVDGWCPTQLEWNMKLWWPHNEAMIAFLMAFQKTKEKRYLDKFLQVYDYSYAHFVDTTAGEWYGYLTREGQPNMRFKGGPYKGCFHVPRCLMMCEAMLREILQESKAD